MSTNSAAAISTAGAKTDKTNAGTSSLSMSLRMKAKLNSWANDEESSTVATDAGNLRRHVNKLGYDEGACCTTSQLTVVVSIYVFSVTSS